MVRTIRELDRYFGRLQLRLFQVLGRKGRVEILAYLLHHPREERTVRELAALTRTPAMTASRAVEDLRGVGVVRRRRVGAAYAISLDPESAPELRRLIDAVRYE